MDRQAPVLVALALAASAFVVSAAGKPPAGSPLGVGTVFLPNPVADLGDETLTDQKDADYAALAPAYHDVVLTDLDGTGFLVGDWAQIVSETGDPAYSTSNEFRYRRDDDRFEQVMAYYWITEAQKYIQSLGFGVSRRPVNMESQRVRINQWGLDNSFATDHPKNELRFGKGGVDDAEGGGRDPLRDDAGAALFALREAEQLRGGGRHRLGHLLLAEHAARDHHRRHAADLAADVGGLRGPAGRAGGLRRWRPR